MRSESGYLPISRIFLDPRADRRSLDLPAVFARHHTLVLLEKSGEMTLGGKTEIQRNIGQVIAGVGQGVERLLHFEHVDIHHRREAGAALEQLEEMRAAEIDARGDF